MGWGDPAPYMFEGDGQQMGPLDRAPPDIYLEDDRTYLVRHWLCQPGHVLAYRYEFEDDWRHTIVLEQIIELEPGQKAQPRCVDGARACPPEHSGGTAGYQALVEAWFDRLNPAHAATRDILGCVGFEPDTFDVEEADRRVRGGRPATPQPSRAAPVCPIATEAFRPV